jgi:hypothetical protein
LPLALGVLVIVGFALSVISGMLYRIVPFLLWLELQRHIAARPAHLKQIMPDRHGRLQVWLHAAATLALLAAAVGRNDLVYAGAALLAASGLTLGLSLSRAWWFTRHALRGVEPLPALRGGRRHGWRELKR